MRKTRVLDGRIKQAMKYDTGLFSTAVENSPIYIVQNSRFTTWEKMNA
jgi:hypothetical protein